MIDGDVADVVVESAFVDVVLAGGADAGYYDEECCGNYRYY